MEIIWLGHSCFRISSGDLTIVTDPYGPSLGLSLGPLTASFVTYSHPHPHHSYGAALEGRPRAIQGPGEYEIAGTYVRGLRTALNPEAGDGGRNTVYLLEVDGLTLCHLGDLGRVPDPRLVEELGTPHVLLVPAGGVCTISVTEVVGAISLLNPRVVVPMHYSLPGLSVKLGPVDLLMKEMGVREATPQTRLTVTPENIPEETTFLLLERAQA